VKKGKKRLGALSGVKKHTEKGRHGSRRHGVRVKDERSRRKKREIQVNGLRKKA